MSISLLGRRKEPIFQSIVCPSVHFDHTVDLCNKPETAKESNRTWKKNNKPLVRAKIEEGKKDFRQIYHLKY